MAPSDLLELLERVTDRDSFLAFVTALERDRATAAARPGSPYQHEAGDWQNGTIEDFLEGALGWARTNGNGARGLAADSPWRWFAEFLHAGKIHG